MHIRKRAGVTLLQFTPFSPVGSDIASPPLPPLSER